MKNRWQPAGVLLVIICCIVSFLAGRHMPAAGKDGRREIITLRDTVVRHDTIRIGRPQAVKEVFREKIVEKLAVRIDTVYIHDSVPVEIPLTYTIYTDSAYRAVVSGYKAQLDSLEIYSRNTTVASEVFIPMPARKTPRWSAGIQAGYGAGFQSSGPYIGIGVQYTIFSW